MTTNIDYRGRAVRLVNRGVRPFFVVLPEATRDSQIKRWRLRLPRTGDRPPVGVDEYDGPDAEDRTPLRRIRRHDDGRTAALEGGRWMTVGHGWNRYPGAGGGLTTHRGVLHPDEYVDEAALLAEVEARLGFSAAQVKTVYRPGRLSAGQRDLRDRIDARLLEIAEGPGIDVAKLGRVLALTITRDGHCDALRNAIRRARSRLSPNDPRLAGIRRDGRETAAAVFNALAARVSGDGTASFRKGEIAAEVGRGERQTYEAVRVLVRRGLLEPVEYSTPLGPGRGSTPSRYAVRL